MSDNVDMSPIDITIIENQDTYNIANRRRNNDEVVAYDDTDYREISLGRDREENTNVTTDDAALALLLLIIGLCKVK